MHIFTVCIQVTSVCPSIVRMYDEMCANMPGVWIERGDIVDVWMDEWSMDKMIKFLKYVLCARS